MTISEYLVNVITGGVCISLGKTKCKAAETDYGREFFSLVKIDQQFIHFTSLLFKEGKLCVLGQPLRELLMYWSI